MKYRFYNSYFPSAKYFFILFIFHSCLHLISILVGEIPSVQTITKLHLIPALLLYVVATTDSVLGSISVPFSKKRIFIGALIASFMGDALLIGDGEIYFLLGLGSFLITHILYTLVFFQIRIKDQNVSRKSIFFIALVFGVALLFLVTGLQNFGPLLIPVALYTFCISCMVSSAILLEKSTPSGSYVFLCMGSLLFFISDFLLALNKFAILPVPYSGFFVMLTYIAAQWFLVKGFLQHYK